MMAVTKKAYAKINLYLDVLGKRPDGYHDIKSVMLQVSLHDDITVIRDGGEGIRLIDLSGETPTGDENIAYRCADAFLRHYDLREGICIHIRKRIPIAAGLGGGSADGAAVLSAMSELFGDQIPSDLDTLCAIGCSQGADIPFCVVGGCALTLGIGDRITPLSYCPSSPIVLAHAGEGISTPLAYRRLDERYGEALAEDSGDFSRFLTSLEQGDTPPAAMRNIFEDVIFPMHPQATHIWNFLRDCGGEARMSGSGPSVFGIFRKEAAARKACEQLQRESVEAFVCHAVSRDKSACFAETEI